MTTPTAHPMTQALIDFIDKSPTPYHCVEECRAQLDAAGFVALDEGASWVLSPGAGYYIARGGTIIAFRMGAAAASEGGFRIIGAHTDSPHLKLKPQPDVHKAGFWQLGVETYGGTLDYSWLDRDLGLAGRVLVRGEGGPTDISGHLVEIRRPIARVPSLAIHLNRAIRTDGLKLNKQKHLAPILGMSSANGETPGGALRRLLSRELGVAAQSIISWDLSFFDVVSPCLGGIDGDFVFAPRLDNQASSHAALAALIAATPGAATTMITLYDHEECGSQSATGADGPMVEWALRRIVMAGGAGAGAAGDAGTGETDALARAVSRSYQVSADMAHGVHPNYEDRHEPQHKPKLNHGPVIKLNQNMRYATDGETAALFEAICVDAGVPVQKFVNRTDLACGTTIGPISSARLGIRTVDVGNPMLSMHSIREQCGAQDHAWMVEAMTRFLEV